MRRTLVAVAAAATLLLAACGDDDDSSGLGGGQPPTTPEGPGELQPADDQDGAPAGGEAAAGDAQAFCDSFTAMGPVPSEWDPNEVQSMTPPPEIADAWNAILGGDTSLSLQSEVTNWVTENCF